MTFLSRIGPEEMINYNPEKEEYFIYNYKDLPNPNKESFFSLIRNTIGDKDTVINICCEFDYSDFLSTIQYNEFSPRYDYNFDRCVFHKKADFSRARFNRSLFLIEISIKNTVFKKEFVFTNCKCEYDISFSDTIFKSCCDFSNSEFLNKARFYNAKFYDTASFTNTKFRDLADFYSVDFFYAQQFHLTDFLGIAVFSNVTFHKQVQFLYNKISQNSVISFESAKFKQALDISRSNFWCKLHFWGAEIDVNPPEMWLYANDRMDKQLFDFGQRRRPLSRIRESLRMIKNEFESENNKINALELYREEMVVYYREVRIDRGNYQEKLVLIFNKLSNNFGLSWTRGVAFTLFIGVFFYTFFLLCMSDKLVFYLSWQSVAETVKHYFEFLNIAKWDLEPFGISDYNWSYLFLFLGRIFIGFGYYQTIQAFRKYGRK